MKKVMGVGAALMVAGVMGVQAASEPEISAEASLLSSYVFRGMVLNNDAVMQPQVTVEHYGVSFNIFGNYDIGSNFDGVSSDFSEIDCTLAYELPLAIEDLVVSVGLTHYTFPNVTVGGAARESTTEIFAKGTLKTLENLEIPVIPSMTIFGDVDEVNGTYVLFDVYVPYQITPELSSQFGFSAGYGNTAYNDFYFGQGQGIDADWNDFNFNGALSYAVTDDLTASANLTYTVLNGGAIEDGADAIYEDDEKLWCGLSVAYDF